MDSPFDALLALVTRDGCPHGLHEHADLRTVEDARADRRFDVARLVKTIAFATREGGLVLACLRGTLRVDYAKLAGVLGIGRRDLAALAPDAVLERLGVAPGGVSPLLPAALPLPETLVLVDEDVLTIAPTAYCGAGRADRTLELAPSDLLRLSGGRTAAFSR